MTRKISFFLFGMLLLGTLLSCSNQLTYNVKPQRPPVKHDLWDQLLKKHVNAEGFVDYKGMIRDSAQLNQYLELLQSAHPQRSWSREEQMAYWINAYNAFTVKLIVDHYPVSSIKDIKNGIPFVNTVWDIKFINIQGQEYDLNAIEHGILRKNFRDGRLHAAVNCASFSCPPLRAEAYTAERLVRKKADLIRGYVACPVHRRRRAHRRGL